MATHAAEDATVRAFIVPGKRGRYASFLGNPKQRGAILDGLNHCRDFDARFATALPPSADVPKLLRSYGAAPGVPRGLRLPRNRRPRDAAGRRRP